MKFQPGDKVKFLNQRGGGVIMRIISQQLVSVAIEDGFEIPTMTSELLKVDTEEKSALFFQKSGSAGNNPVTQSQHAGPAAIEQMKQDQRIFSLKKSQDSQDAGVWLSFHPRDQKWLITGEVQVYLLNNSEYEVLYSVFLRDQNGEWLGIDYDVIPPWSGIVVETCAREELNRWQEGLVQLLFQKERQLRVIPPVHTSFRIRMTRLQKEDNYIEPPFYTKRMVMVRMAELLPETTGQHTGEGKDPETTARHSRTVDKSQALIDKHRVAPFEAEVDLHISSLHDDYGHLTKHEILKLQVDYFKRTLESALMHQYKKITFIHGIGNGTLRDTILQILNEYEDLKPRNAPFQTYGYGAVEVLNHGH